MDTDQAKLFVGGISWETSEDTLREHFSKYGTVLGLVIAKDRNTGNPRGFAFVSFSDSDSADEALKDKHVILGRTVEVKKAIPRSEQQQQQGHSQQQPNRGSSKNSSNGSSNDQFKTKKIFVGGLSGSLTEEEFKNYFERFGRITDVVVMYDSTTHRPRGFGFVTFDSEESVENVMQKNFHELNGRSVEVKRAVPKEWTNGSNNGYNTGSVVGSGSLSNNYWHGNYPPYSPGYGILPGYGPLPGYGYVGAPLYGTSIYGGGYPMGGYGGIGYGIAPIAPSSPWNGPGTIGARGSLLPYGYAPTNPAYINGGVGAMGMAVNGFNGIVGPGVNGKLNQVVGGNGHVPIEVTPPRMERVKLEVDS